MHKAAAVCLPSLWGGMLYSNSHKCAGDLVEALVPGILPKGRPWVGGPTGQEMPSHARPPSALHLARSAHATPEQ